MTTLGPEISEVGLSSLERMLELWQAMSETERWIRTYNDHAGEVVRELGTDRLSEHPYYIDLSQMQEQRNALAEAITGVLREERRAREIRKIGLPVRDDELAKQFQKLWTAAVDDGSALWAASRDVKTRYDENQWRKFQQMLFQRGIVV